jgi:hypothetical protein
MIRERLVKVIENLAPTPIAWIAIVAGIFVHFVGFFLFKVKVPNFSEFTSPEAYVSYVTLEGEEGNSQLRDRALLSDSYPLFLPSAFDYSASLMQPSYYVEDRNASMLAPFRFNVTTDALGILTDPFIEKPQPRPRDLLASDLWSFYQTLGERGVDPTSLPDRFGLFEFKEESSGKTVREVVIEDSPIEESVRNLFWKPCEILVYVGQEGCMGEPLINITSGTVAIDQYVVKWIQRYTNRRMIPAGYYRVIFGP